MAMFTWSVLEHKRPFLANLIKKIKIVHLSWYLIPRLIQICRIQWWCLVFLFSTKNTLFWLNLVKKFKIISLVSFFFWYTFLGYIWYKNQNCLFKKNLSSKWIPYVSANSATHPSLPHNFNSKHSCGDWWRA